MSETALPLWRDDRGGWFLANAGEVPPVGAQAIRSIDGRQASADPAWLEARRIDEGQAKAWVSQTLGAALGEARERIDATLAEGRARLDAARRAPAAEGAPVTPDAVPALWALAKALPSAIVGGLSGDPVRVAEASGAMADIQWRLRDAGIGVDDRLQGFPERLAAMRRDIRQKP